MNNSDFVTEYNGGLSVGDFILVCYTNVAYPGFYLGRGQGESVQYFLLYQLTEWLKHQGDRNYNTKAGRPAKGFVIASHGRRIIKYDPSLLSEKYQEEFTKALEALKILKVIK